MVSLYPYRIFSDRISIMVALFMAMLVCMASQRSAAEVEARLDRESVPAGNPALLTLTISGESADEPMIPEVENLIVQSRGQSKQIQMMNGHTSISVTYNYIVGSNTPGDYQIPAIEVSVDGKKISTRPLKLKVLDQGAAQPTPSIPPNPSGTPPAAEAAEDAGKRFGFLTVELAANDRKHVYVGEIAPVRIQAWLPAGSQAGLRSGIQPEGKAFTLHNVSSRPQQTQETKNGKQYTVITWFGGMSATKAGKYPASLSLDATVAVRDTAAPKPRRRMGGPFDDPFFGSVFDQMNTPMIQKEVTLKSDDQEIEVRPLPTEGRPAGFTGAVGEFKFDSAEIPGTWKTGEPQQITSRLSGSGNFSLMNAPTLTPADAWKTYPGKGEFTAGDVTSFSGSKSFQFSAVPRKGGAQDAALSFSYFDPTAGAYKTLTSEAARIQVSGADILEDKPAAEPSVIEPEKPHAGLVGQHLKIAPVATLVPLVSRPAFNYMLGSAAGLCVLGAILAWLRVRREDPKRRALAALEKVTREALEAANAASDVPGFFAAARLAIQQRLGALWNQPAQAITLAEIQSRIPDDSPVTRFFREADRHEYNRLSSGEVLPQWRTLLAQAMASITPSTR